VFSAIYATPKMPIPKKIFCANVVLSF
jgi:hypothetical protein